MTTQQKLDELAALQDQVAALTERFEQIKAFHLAPVQEAIDRAEAAMKAEVAEIQPAIDGLIKDIKADVEGRAQSIKGRYLHAVYSKGRVSWDGKMLEGFALAHPVILQARSFGKPSVTLRQIKPTQED